MGRADQELGAGRLGRLGLVVGLPDREDLRPPVGPLGHDADPSQMDTLPEDDAWREGRSLVATVQDDELIDPTVSSERLLYQLFHQRGVRVFRSRKLVAQCSCSRDGVAAMLGNFSQDDRDHMVENGAISVTCEFCSANYQFAPDDVRPDANRPETVGGSSETKPSS